MPINSLDEKMIMDLRAAGEDFKDCPVLKSGATQAEEEIHKAMVNNWRTKLFLKWQTMQDLKTKKLPE
ncbi:MAG: hypothetical protein EOO38_16795 [Cytophagaceae bacterium]|nr:MAG: hypothetical protein EOO38_16795 [Cytophagaceae bacterium]